MQTNPGTSTYTSADAHAVFRRITVGPPDGVFLLRHPVVGDLDDAALGGRHVRQHHQIGGEALLAVAEGILDKDRERFAVSPNGIVVVPKGFRF